MCAWAGAAGRAVLSGVLEGCGRFRDGGVACLSVCALAATAWVGSCLPGLVALGPPSSRCLGRLRVLWGGLVVAIPRVLGGVASSCRCLGCCRVRGVGSCARDVVGRDSTSAPRVSLGIVGAPAYGAVSRGWCLVALVLLGGSCAALGVCALGRVTAEAPSVARGSVVCVGLAGLSRTPVVWYASGLGLLMCRCWLSSVGCVVGVRGFVLMSPLVCGTAPRFG